MVFMAELIAAVISLEMLSHREPLQQASRFEMMRS